MKIIVPCNNKGGVGKTCVAAILADYFSKVQKKKTLVIDLDPQCNISQRFMQMEIDPNKPDGHRPSIHPDYRESDEEWDGRSSIADIFLRPQAGVVPYPTMNENLDIMPAHASDLLAVEQCRQEEVLEKIYDRFKAFLNMPDVHESYDYVIVDTAPSKGPLTRSAVRAATHLIIPTQMEDKPIRGVFGMMQLWMQETKNRNDDNQLNLIGILPNMFDTRTALHTSMYHDLQKNETIAEHLMPCKLSRRITFAENDTENPTPKSIFDLPSNNKAKQECLVMCEYVVAKIESTHKETVYG
ncbi:MAG: ParA family protein [Coxiellaceae bacterium]|nr:ParA family protein [Coxiellaceae bacterium]